MTRREKYTEKEVMWQIEKEQKVNLKIRNRLAESMNRLNYWFNYLKEVSPKLYAEIEAQSNQMEMKEAREDKQISNAALRQESLDAKIEAIE